MFHDSNHYVLINEKNNLNTVNDQIRPQFRIAPLSIKPRGVKAILRNKAPFEKAPRGATSIFRYNHCFTLFAASKEVNTILLFVFYWIFYVTTLRKPKKQTKLQNVVLKPPKIIIEWILSAWNNISCEAIGKSFKSCALTTALDGDENDQIHCFKLKY